MDFFVLGRRGGVLVGVWGVVWGEACFGFVGEVAWICCLVLLGIFARFCWEGEVLYRVLCRKSTKMRVEAKKIVKEFVELKKGCTFAAHLTP